MVRVLFVGSNPSEASRGCYPFEKNTRSWRVLLQWIETAGLNPDEQVLCNVTSVKTKGNRPLTNGEITLASRVLKSAILDHDCTHIVALGKTANKALKQIGCNFLEMPHPSGLNRKLNNKDYVEEMLNKLKEYTSET